MQTLLDKCWHHITAEKAAELLDVNTEKGLDVFETESRLKDFGENVIASKKTQPAWKRFLLQFHQPLIYILIISGIITAALGEWVDSIVILGVVLVNAVTGFFQELKAVRALSALASSMRVQATVIRGGTKQTMDASQLVPGDVVLLGSGDKIPADMRIVQSWELRVDESTLTGESIPTNKNSNESPKDAVLADRHGMAYAGTIVSYGQGRGIVVATGGNTELGRISGLVESAQDIMTPLTRKIAHFSHILLVAILFLAGFAFVFGVLRDEPATEMLMAAVALAVGAIPEGLPAAITVILALGVSRMAEKRAIIRKLPAVETLGGTTVICSDKTGTLTRNEMTVQAIYCGQASYAVSGSGYDTEGVITPQNGATRESETVLQECLRAGMLCNDADLKESEGKTTIQGDPTEAALLVAAAKGGLDRATESRSHPRVSAIPFESDLQYMATLHKGPDGHVAYMKGAVEVILARCNAALGPDGTSATPDKNEINDTQITLASKGLRVLALARKRIADPDSFDKHSLESNMEFLGLQGMIDPPRTEVKEAIDNCHRAGVDVKMITGDHAVTAQAIGNMLGLERSECVKSNSCRVLTGREIADMSDTELMEDVREVSVFARVSPEQKLRLVMALQSQGEICAMTGDGVNDSPALRQANIGIAMGQSGTEAAKEAADMVLTDDNFATIEAAVEEGRGVFANLTKFIAWTLPTNAGEGLVILAAILFGATLPILPVQILWINMTTAGSLGMMLAFEPKEKGIMNRPPRRPDKPLWDKVIIRRVAMVSLLLLASAFGLFKLEVLTGATIEEARTMAVNVFVAVEAFYLFNSRSFERSPFDLGIMSNPWVIGGFLFSFLLQLAYTYVPFMNTVFGSAPISLFGWFKVLACGVIVFLLVEMDKRRDARRQ